MKLVLALSLIVVSFAQEPDDVLVPEKNTASFPSLETFEKDLHKIKETEDTRSPSTPSVELQFQQAQAFIDQQISKGKSDLQCRTLAKGMKKQVRDSVEGQQKILNKMPRGKKCNSAGSQGIARANRRLLGAKENAKQAKTALAKVRKKTINFGNFEYEQLSEGKCGSFFNQGIWKRAKAAVSSARNKKKNADMAVIAAKKSLQDAKIEAQRLVRKCKCAVKRNLDKALESMNRTARNTNMKAWRKSTHLMCILKGNKNLKRCRVSKLPTVKAVKLSKQVRFACITQTWKSTGSLRVKGPGNKTFKFTLVTLPKSKGWIAGSAASKKRYVKLCKARGLMPVGCGQSSYDCGHYQGRNNCVSLPTSFSCDAIGGATRVAKLKGNIIGYYTSGRKYSSSYFYTAGGSNGYPKKNTAYQPLCAKYGH